MNFNKKYILDFAKEILEIPSPSGFCETVVNRVLDEAKKYNLETSKTKKGNGIISIKGSSDYTIGLAVHVDTLGLMVRSITGKGELMFTNIGGPILSTLDAEYCTIHTRGSKDYTGTVLSTSPAVHVFKDANTKPRNIESMYVRLDEVVKTKADVEKLGISVGDFISIDTKTQVTKSGFIKSRFLDDKINVASIFGLIDYLKTNNITPRANIEIIISTYEEVGHGSAAIPNVDELIAIDMGCVGKDLTCTEFDVSICAKDSSGPYDYNMITKFKELAVKNKINHAIDVYPYYGSDVSAALRGGNDIKGGLIGPGVHASHGMERTHYDGIEATMQLLVAYLK